MCGICGIFGEYSKDQIKKMTATLIHRGPDDNGYFFDEGIGLGFRRLSIIDLKKGLYPIFNEDKSVLVIFNGEIYNYKELRKSLEKSGHKFYTNTDTEVIVHAYEQFGENDFADKFNGMFGFALYDSNKRKLILARDRVGIKPLYYVLSNSNLLFGSEIKAIISTKEIKPELDFDAVSSYFSFGTSFDEKTLFKGIKRLLPGHMLISDSKTVRIRKYVKGSSEKINVSPKSLRKLVEESVQSQMVADVPVGAYLSGGIDSSTVVALMKRSNDDLKTFNIGFGREDDESQYARLVADDIGTDHHEIFIYSGEVPKILQDFIYYYDDLNWDAAALPVYKLSKYAKKYVTVVLTGEGGDELFAGYNRYKFFSNYFWFTPAIIKQRFYERFLKMTDNNTWRNIIKNPSIYGEKIYKDYFKNSKSLQSVLDFELNETLPNQLLTKVDRATMAGSIEARVPLLDNTLLDFSKNTPINLKLRGFNGKYIFKLAVKDLLPQITIKRAKRGFGASPYYWFKDKEIMDFAISILDDSHVREDYINIQEYKKFIDIRGFNKGRKAHALWIMLCFELWYRKFIV
ncbi:asparagine synthase (glutamine-hydrolyzing) [Candidatus Micrarchaeota archaeon]|nr:asparagine synthase (glutamine-hydrolyzing) [Candidatus Micrarchaeota archaeon]